MRAGGVPLHHADGLRLLPPAALSGGEGGKWWPGDVLRFALDDQCVPFAVLSPGLASIFGRATSIFHGGKWICDGDESIFNGDEWIRDGGEWIRHGGKW